MKKYIFVFLIFTFVAIGYLSFPYFPEDSPGKTENFVTLENNKFKLNGNDFYPVVLNYIAMLQYDGSELWPCPSRDYNVHPSLDFFSKDSCLKKLRADFHLIKKMGFNTVRIVGIGEVKGEENNEFTQLSATVYLQDNQSATVTLDGDEMYARYFEALSLLFNEINKAGLRAILLLRTRPGISSTESFLVNISKYFKEETTILAYDLFNEPLYFDRPDREKEEVFNLANRWNNLVKENAPQLTTIGLEGIREVFEWDPNILGVDFISFHPYEYEPEQVRNEIFWYGRYVKKPWIIGETAIPADNDSIRYDLQREFAYKTIRQTINCGAMGYSWWQYKDVDWAIFHQSYMGVINRKGETTVENLMVKGTPKPLVAEIEKIDFTGQRDSCLCFENYYNYSNHHLCRLSGILTDENGKAIEGGVILGWNEVWDKSYHTITKPDGSFELRGDFKFFHWMASATLYSMVRGELLPDSTLNSTGSILTINMDTIKIRQLSL